MPLFRRPDGQLARDVPAYRRIMPYLMRGKTESLVYFEQQIDLERTLPFLEDWNATHEHRITVFHLFLWAAVRVLGERPRLNRFVSGGRIYQRDGIWISFSAKKALSDDAPIVVLKRELAASIGLPELVDGLYDDLGRGRGEGKSRVDRELSLVLALPGPGVRLLLWLGRALDALNLLPGSLIRTDPMYASMFIANLGSLKLEAAYHHLYEYGNIPVFAALGRIKKVPVVTDGDRIEPRSVCDVRYTFDERIEDGLYCAAALDRLRRIVEDPGADSAAGSSPRR